MVPRNRMWLTVAVLTMTAAVSLRAGGWSVITVDDLPEFGRAGQPFTITYAVRQHGVSLTSDLRGRLEARAEDEAVVVASAVPGAPGYYKATLTVPRPGRWTLNVNSGFVEGMTGRPAAGDIQPDGPPMTLVAVAAEGPRPAAQTPSERGRHLYVAKGCVTCHAHARSDVRSFDIGPDLTDARRAPEYLHSVLSRGVRGREQADDIRMPDLRLQSSEIDALVAFLQTSGQTRVTQAR